jgi:hypothetical protein
MSARRKNILKIFCSTVIVAALLTACVPDPLQLDDIPIVKPQIVVSTQIIPDQSLVVLLTKTFSALTPVNDSVPDEFLKQIVVDDAIVTISGPQGTDTLISLDNGVYGGVQIEFQSGEEYTLHVKSESVGEVSATTVVKPLVPFKEISAELYYNGFDDTLAQVTYTLNDPTGANMYMINVQKVERNDAIENFINPRAFTKLVDDESFDGIAYGETFRVIQRYSPGDTIAVSLSNISDEYYRFVKLRLDNRFNFAEFLGEPVNYPSNVKGGHGYFNLFIPDFRFFVLE